MDNKNKNNAIAEMNNFGVLSTSTTPTSSTTPGPPPFHIAHTPLYVRRCPFWSIHPDLLRDVNTPVTTNFDIESREGYPSKYAYNNYIIAPNGSKYFTHTTFTSPIQNQSPLKSPHDHDGPSPSLLHLQPTQTQIQKQPIQTINPIPGQYEYEYEYEYEYKYNMYQQINMILSDLGTAIHKMGINSTTGILIIIAIFIAVQLNQYNTIRDDNRKINNLKYISVEQVLTLLEKQQINYETKINKLNQTLDNIQNQSTNMIQLIDQNTVDIAENQANITQKTDAIISMQSDIKNNVNQASMDASMDYFAYQQRTNWISGVVRKPQIIPYSFNDVNEHKNEIGFNVFTAFKRGLQIWHNESKYGAVDVLRYTANIDISATATPMTLQPNDCLQFNSDVDSRWIEISLIEKIIVSEFEYIHIDKKKVQERDKNKSPKSFMLFGKLRGDDEWRDIQVKEDNVLGVNESVIKLELEMTSGIELMRIEYDVNEGATTTRLYRMRVHGVPDVYD